MKKIPILVILIFILITYAYSQENQTDKEVADYIGSGDKFVSMEKLEEANLDFQKAVELKPNNIEALEKLAKTYLLLGNNRDAEKVLDKILELQPDNIPALIGLAKIYSWNNRYEESIKLYKKALELDPKNIEAQNGLAEVYNWGGRRKESINQYEEILIQDPRNMRAYKGLAEVYTWDDRLKEAERIYQEALKKWPENVDLHLGLAKIYGWMELWSRAQEEYRKVLNIEPKNAQAQEGLKQAEKALVPQSNFVFKYINERDAADWRARTLSYGYKFTRFLDYGNNLYAAYYLNDLRETGYTHKFGNILELGGRYNLKDKLILFGSTDLRTYSHGPNFFSGIDIGTMWKYYQRNSFTLKYSRNLFDVMDQIRGNRYGAESNIYLSRFILLTDSYTYTDYSDDNYSTDWYHILTFILHKKKPDLNLGFGYRRRDFEKTISKYYSPQGLESKIVSLYTGMPIKKNYFYGLFKFSDNSDHVDNYYYLLGNDYAFNDSASLIGEISYFDTSGKYHALTTTLTLRLKF